MSENYDLVIIGAGPGGYVCAIKAAQLGLKVAVVDKRAEPGGTCLNVGCIPSKVMLNSSHKYWESKHHFASHGIIAEGIKIDLAKMQARKQAVVSELSKGIEFLFRKNGVTFVNGTATIKGPNFVQVTRADKSQQTLETKYIVIATGSETASIPGVEIDEDRIVSSTGALNFTKVPKHLVVIGGGYIGLELGSVWARLGADVTVVEYLDRIVPLMDHEVGAAFHKALVAQGITFKLERKVHSVMTSGKGLALHMLPASSQGVDHKPGDPVQTPEIITCDRVLVATGRRPLTQGLGLEAVGVETDQRGFIKVNYHYQTTCSNIFAIGDVIPGPMLAHKAEEEGVALAELLAGQSGHVNYGIIPAIVYTNPEVATIGVTEEQAKEAGIAYRIGKFPFLANSRAKCVGDTTGFVKLITEEATDRVIGAHIIGEQAGNMISEVAIAMEFGASAEDIARTCHAHPTHSEALKEAAMIAYLGKAIHI